MNIIDEFGDDVEKELVNCSFCNIELLILEHSLFENGYYLYCDSCPKRVDISIYDKKYEEIESELKKQYANFDEREDALFILLSEVQKHLHSCDCGGSFSLSSKIRCLNCGEPLGDYPDYMNVWYLNDFEENSEKSLINTYVIEPNWL